MELGGGDPRLDSREGFPGERGQPFEKIRTEVRVANKFRAVVGGREGDSLLNRSLNLKPAKTRTCQLRSTFTVSECDAVSQPAPLVFSLLVRKYTKQEAKTLPIDLFSFTDCYFVVSCIRSEFIPAVKVDECVRSMIACVSGAGEGSGRLKRNSRGPAPMSWLGVKEIISTVGVGCSLHASSPDQSCRCSCSGVHHRLRSCEEYSVLRRCLEWAAFHGGNKCAVCHTQGCHAWARGVALTLDTVSLLGPGSKHGSLDDKRDTCQDSVRHNFTRRGFKRHVPQTFSIDLVQAFLSSSL